MSSTTTSPATLALISMFFDFGVAVAHVQPPSLQHTTTPSAASHNITQPPMPKHKRAASTGASNSSSNVNNSSSDSDSGGSGSSSDVNNPGSTSVAQQPSSTPTPSPSSSPTSAITSSATSDTSPTVQPTSSSATTSDNGPSSSPASSTASSHHSSTTTHHSTPSSDIVGSSSINPSTLSHKTTITHALVTQHTSQRTFTSVYTRNGEVTSSTETRAVVMSSTTGFATSTISPGLAHGGGSGSNLSTNDKAIIGGVVGGVGGAILLAGLAYVGFRLWGKRKNRQQIPQDDVWDGQQEDKRESQQPLSSSNTDGLERYRLGGSSVGPPTSSPNTASNF